MTTIATDGKSMAADGLVTSATTIFGTRCEKIRRLADGRIVGVAGSAFHLDGFCKFIAGDGELPTLDPENFDALVLCPDGSVFSYGHQGTCIPEETPTACGSGRELAIGAMEFGASPKEAVEIACRRDTLTGGEVTVLAIGLKAVA